MKEVTVFWVISVVAFFIVAKINNSTIDANIVSPVKAIIAVLVGLVASSTCVLTFVVMMTKMAPIGLAPVIVAFVVVISLVVTIIATGEPKYKISKGMMMVFYTTMVLTLGIAYHSFPS